MPPSDSGHKGTQQTSDTGSDLNAHSFLIRSILGRVSTSTLVQVVAVTNDGGLSPVGFVDALPLVNQVDGDGNATPHGVIYGIPYFRLQGGENAVIIDPQEGDIGIAVFADHDISSVKANKRQANPGSRRRFEMADGIYIGGVLNGAPTQYIQFSSEGVTVFSPTSIKVIAPEVSVIAENAHVHASNSCAQDVNGYGSRTTFTGGSNFHIDTYTTGAVVTTTEHGWMPPELPE